MHLTGFPGKPGRAPFQKNAAKPTSTNGEIMKKHLLNNLPFVLAAFALLLGLATTAYGGVPSMDVTVFDANARVAFKGRMSANATFATQNLPSGKYVVQFNAKRTAVQDKYYLLVVSAGKKKVVAFDVPGRKFMAGGVAMKVDVGSGTKITGQVATEQAVAQGDASKYRMIDGKRYCWVSTELGSNLKGHWAEEGLATSGNVTLWSSDEIRKWQHRAGEGSMLTHHHYDPPPRGY